MFSSEEQLEHVEKRLLTDNEYYENMQSIEDELIQYYADGKLGGAEKEAFEARFLTSKDSLEQIKFARVFRNYLDDQPVPRVILPVKRSIFARLFSFPSSQLIGGTGSGSSLRLAGAVGLTAILVVFSSFFAWNWYANYGVRQGLAALNKAYEHERPLESRVSGLNYAPYYRLRSGEDSQVDKNEVERAKRQIVDSGDPFLLGNLYLTQKDFDAAIQQLKKALLKDPKNAEIYSNLGVAYLEKGQAEEDKGIRFRMTVQAYDNFEKALQIKPDLQPALFNKARCLEALPLVNQAKEAWEEYLKHDGTTKWATEARDRLRELEEQTSQEKRDANNFQQAFLDAAAAGRDDEAFKLASVNRELITERYLPQKLVMSLVETDDEGKQAELQRALKYLGRLEKERNQDNFTADLAAFYENLPPKKKEIVKNAQAQMRKGYELCIDEGCRLAINNFTSARDLFLQAGDVIEAKTVADYFIAYCRYSSDRQAALESFKQIDTFALDKKYRWFALMNLDWVIGGQSSLGLLLPTDVDNRYQLALKEAEAMRDIYMTQKFLRSLNSRDRSVRQEKHTYTYLQRIFEYSGEANASSRQKERGLNEAFETLASMGFTALSRAIVQERLESQEKRDKQFVIDAQKSAGKVYTQNDELPEAERWFNDAIASAADLGDALKQKEMAEIMLGLGGLEFKKKNFLAAVQRYNQSLQIQKEIKEQELQAQKDTGGQSPQAKKEVNDSPLLYETMKLRLLAYEKLEDDAEIEKDLPQIINLAEEKRRRLTKEEERASFFKYEQEIYDVAIEHELRADNIEEAFNYAEASNSRSLLDQLQSNKNIANDASSLRPGESAQPLSVSQIRGQIPANVQLLQYAVLKDRVLIWVISNDKFEMVSSSVNLADMKNKIELYIDKITSHDRSQQDQARGLAQEFYNLLITPVLPQLDRDKEICLIPNQILFKLPFAALVSPNGRYLIQEFDMFYSPSANVFVLSTQKAQERSGPTESLLAIGDPAFDRQQLPGLQNLPESIKEVRSIAGNYSVPNILVSGEATKKAFRQAMGSADVIHFAGHYLVHPEAPLLSELVMAKSPNAANAEDNFFTNAELRAEKLPRTRLVILSACQTGVESDYNGEGLVGLSRTFLSLSVPLVVASQWSVESGATAELMKKLHRYRKQESLSTIKALRKAQLEMVNAADERFRSPYYWASFAAFGGYAEF
jgi:CHAT domain-containing protein